MLEQEIERRFLVREASRAIKELANPYPVEITTCYPIRGDNYILRFREEHGIRGNTYCAEAKFGTGTSRLNLSENFGHFTFLKLLSKWCEGVPKIRKNRFYFELGEHKGAHLGCLDIYLSIPLIKIEIEFKDEEQAREFQIPDGEVWVEVTDDPRFNEANLAGLTYKQVEELLREAYQNG